MPTAVSLDFRPDVGHVADESSTQIPYDDPSIGSGSSSDDEDSSNSDPAATATTALQKIDILKREVTIVNGGASADRSAPPALFKPTSSRSFSAFSGKMFDSNEIREKLERRLAGLDGGKYGLVYASGFGALLAVVQSLVQTNDHILADVSIYSGTVTNILQTSMWTMGVKVKYVCMRDREELRRRILDGPKVVIMEILSNPLLEFNDIAAISEIVREFSHAVLVVDNTLLTPYSLQPLKHGADVVVHSVSKYLNGHGDVMMGSAVTNSPSLHAKMLNFREGCGCLPSPFECHLAEKGLDTFTVRMAAHQENALAIAKFLQNHPAVTKVLYPGLDSYSNKKAFDRRCKSYGGVVSFELVGGYATVQSFLSRFQLISCAESFGSLETVAKCPATQGTTMPIAEAESRGVKLSLVRLSVGLESIGDLIEDLGSALSGALAERQRRLSGRFEHSTSSPHQRSGTLTANVAAGTHGNGAEQESPRALEAAAASAVGDLPPSLLSTILQRTYEASRSSANGENQRTDNDVGDGQDGNLEIVRLFQGSERRDA